MADQDWIVRVLLGSEAVHYGRSRDPELAEVVADAGPRDKQDDSGQHDWLKAFQQQAEATGATVKEARTQLWSGGPAGPPWMRGVLYSDGGFDAHFLHYLVATWGAVGGIAGITAFLKGVKELKSLWSSDQQVEITLKNGTKVKISSPKDVDRAIDAIKRLEAALTPEQQRHALAPVNNESASEDESSD